MTIVEKEQRRKGEICSLLDLISETDKSLSDLGL